MPLTYSSFPISGVPGLPPVLLPQLGRARHLQEEADPRQGPPPAVQHEGKLIIAELLAAAVSMSINDKISVCVM